MHAALWHILGKKRTENGHLSFFEESLIYLPNHPVIKNYVAIYL